MAYRDGQHWGDGDGGSTQKDGLMWKTKGGEDGLCSVDGSTSVPAQTDL